MHDSHKGFTNVTDTWSHIELLPYKYLLDKNKVDMIMTAHVYHSRMIIYTSISKKHINQTLRDFLNYDGVIITDDLQMRAISKRFDLKTTIIKAIQSEIDMLLFAHLNLYNENVIERAHNIIKEGIASGEINERLISDAYTRIQKLKKNHVLRPLP